MNRAAAEASVLGAVLLGCVLLAVVARRRGGAPRADGGLPAGSDVGFGVGRARELLLRALTTTDHRDIGLLYIAFGTLAALWGGVDAMMMRLELLTPPADVWSEETYNSLFTTHGLTMLLFFVTPVFFGIGNYFLPLLVEADDMAFPRLNALGFWLLPPSLLLARSGLLSQVTGQFLGTVFSERALRFFLTVREPGVGWTLYTPLSVQSSNPQLDLLLLGLHLSGIATTVGAVNFIVTLVYERGENVDWANLDMFSWNMLTTSGLVLFAFPLLGSAIIMLLMDRNFGTTFYAPSGGGPILWQHLFWFFGHPEVYIIFLPAAGLMSTILPKFSGRKLFGFRFIVYSTLGIGVLSFGVWAHHMFVTGVDPRVRASFMAVSIAIAVPSAIKTFNWITTVWDGRIRLTAPMLLCIGGIGTFIVGGVTGVFLAAIPVDILYHGTYYVVGHFHLILMGIIPFMMLAASYYWYPLITGRMYDRRLAMFQSGLFVFGSSLTFLTLVGLGLLELPRRYATYPPEFATPQQVASIGAFILGLSVLLWLYNMIWSYWNGPVVESADVWDLKETDQFSREWQWFERRLETEYGVDPTSPAVVRQSYTAEPGRGSPSFSETIGSVVSNVVGNATAAAAGGLLGTLLMTGVLFIGVIVGVVDLVAFAELASLVGADESLIVGYALFLAGGTTTWALLFVALAEYLPGELRFVTGITYATVISSGFAIAFYTGQSGLELLGYIVFVLVSHWAYGLGLAGTYEYILAVRRRG